MCAYQPGQWAVDGYLEEKFVSMYCMHMLGIGYKLSLASRDGQTNHAYYIGLQYKRLKISRSRFFSPFTEKTHTSPSTEVELSRSGSLQQYESFVFLATVFLLQKHCVRRLPRPSFYVCGRGVGGGGGVRFRTWTFGGRRNVPRAFAMDTRCAGNASTASTEIMCVASCAPRLLKRVARLSQTNRNDRSFHNSIALCRRELVVLKTTARFALDSSSTKSSL